MRNKLIAAIVAAILMLSVACGSRSSEVAVVPAPTTTTIIEPAGSRRIYRGGEMPNLEAEIWKVYGAYYAYITASEQAKFLNFVAESHRREQELRSVPKQPVVTKPVQKPATQPQKSSGGTNNGFLNCVKGRESRGQYTAVNRSSGAGGAYQFLPGTWNNTARHAGRPDLVGKNPASASPSDQDAMAQHLYGWQGGSPWAGPGC